VTERNGHDELSVVGLLEFLSELDATRNPPVYDITTEKIYALEQAGLPAVAGVTLAGTAASWLTVEYLDLPLAPKPPREALPALPSAVTAHAEPVVPPLEQLLATRLAAERRRAEDVPPETVVLTGAQEAELRAAHASAMQWVSEHWRPWSAAYRDVESCKALYRDLFAQQARLATDRDSVEFVWGFGRLRWDTEIGIKVDAPLIAVPVEVELDGKTQALHVRPDGDIEVQVEYLASLSLHDRNGLLASRDALLETGLDPWGAELTPQLRSLVRHLHLSGVIAGEGAAVAHAPVVTPTWVLYMRRRRPKYQAFLAALRELYRGGAQVPLPLQNVVEDRPASTASETRLADPADPLLLPLPANEEQLQILRMAQEPSGVVVQGPPGTGKTHTIANLISHYVAYGKRVLVLAEKERALREVSGKVPEGIRALTVSVLGADEASRRQLGDSINAIQNRVTGLDRDAADAEIARLTAELARMDGGIAATTSAMLSTRSLETTTPPGQWPVPAPVTPQKAAEWLRGNEGAFTAIPDRLGVTTNCPIGAAELMELLRLLTDIGADRAERALQVLPELTDLPSAPDVATWHTTVASAQQRLAAASERVSEWSVLDATAPAELEPLIARTRSLASALQLREAGWLAGVARQLADPLLAPEWREFVSEVAAARERIITMRGPLGRHDVELPKGIASAQDGEFVAHIDRAVNVLGEGGKLGLFARATRAALESCAIDGAPAKTHEHALLVQTAIAVVTARRALVTRWVKQVGVLDGPALSPDQPEVEVREHLDVLRDCVLLEAGWAELTRDLGTLRIEVQPRPSHVEATDVLAALEVLPARVAQRQGTERITALHALLTAGSSAPEASVLWSLLADTVTTGATQRYDELRAEVAALHELRPQARRLRELRDRLAAAAPVWTQQILADISRAGEATALPLAWQYRQLETWIAGILATVEPGVLQSRLHDLVTERRKVVGELVTQRAWRRLADNLGTRERRGLQTYLQAVTRYGKTGGKYEARRAAEIRRAMDECKHAVPVWVMTSSRALASFAPEAEPPFDVLILDEASQAGYTALPLLSLAKQVIVVGDDKQTSPENVGLDRARVFELMDDHLRAVSGYRTLFDPDNSLYDVARQRFTKSVMLVEHFRCLPDIIRFSNTRFYNDEIQPLRDRPPMLDWQPLGAVRVRDGYRSGDVNRPEAEAVVELLARLDQDSRYDGMSFGVVTLLSGGQAQLIDSLLLDRLTPERYRARDLQVGEAAAFQGAERDVMVVSLVVAPDPANPSKGPAAATAEAYQRRLNVAASRAKQQLWVAYSVEPERFHPDDHRGSLIRHCRDPHALDSGGTDTLAKCDSDFERRVATAILGRGYRRLRAQYPVGSESRNYRIDLVVEGRSGRLAIECDGERWHGPDRWHADHARQQVLERAGWTFERIRGSAYYRDPNKALAPLWRRLADLGITPGDDSADAPTSGQVFEVVGGVWHDADGVPLEPVPAPGPAATPAPAPAPTPAPAATPAAVRPAGPCVGPTASAPAPTPAAAAPPSPAVPAPVGVQPLPPVPGGSGPLPEPVPPQPRRIDYTKRPAPPAAAASTTPPRAASATSPARPASAGQRTARDEILASAYRVMATTGRTDFTATEILEDLARVGTVYAENTIKTMISSHLVGDGSLDRVVRGVFRIAPTSRDTTGPTLDRTSDAPGASADTAPRMTGASGRCQGCGKDGLIANTLCRRCRKAG
jgi:very-short-patch-repair endonuclease